MLVSIIVPIYNVENYLQRCIDSLVQQTYSNIEILLIDDGSKDSSLSIAQNNREKFPNIKIFSKPNGGLSDARNFGLKHMRGQYCMFVDSDDWLTLDAVESMVEIAEKTHAEIVCCDMQYVYDDGTKKFSSGGDFKITSANENMDIIFVNPSACNKLFKVELFKYSQFPVGWWYEDLATVPTLIAASHKIAKVDKALYMYYQRAGSIVHTTSPKIFDIYKAINKIKSEISKLIAKENEKQFLDKINDLYIIHCADLTTLRILTFDSNQEKYLNDNIDLLNKVYPRWFNNHLVKAMGIKKYIIFTLLKFRQMKMVIRLIGR